MRGKATTLCLIWERMREATRQRDKKELNSRSVGHIPMGWGRFLSVGRRPEKVPFIHLRQKPIDWKCSVVNSLGSLNMNSGVGAGWYRGGRDAWRGGSGFQQVDSKENRKLST